MGKKLPFSCSYSEELTDGSQFGTSPNIPMMLCLHLDRPTERIREVKVGDIRAVSLLREKAKEMRVTAGPRDLQGQRAKAGMRC